MEDLLREIKAVPGVLGSMVYMDSQGVVSSNLGEDFDEFLLQQVGRLLGRLFHVKGGYCSQVENLDMAWEGYVLSAQLLREDAIIVTFAQADAKLDMINIKSGAMSGELLAELEAGYGKQLTGEPAPQPTEESSVPGSPSPGVSEFLEAVKAPVCDALALAIGPIASVLVADSFAAWEASPAGAAFDVGQLMSTLCEEIDDPDAEAQFRQSLQAPLKQAAAKFAGSPPGKGSDAKNGAPAATANSARLPAKVREKLQAALAQAIGPVATVVLDECEAKWAKSGGAAAADFQSLLKLIIAEVDDPAQLKTFKNEVTTIFKK